MQRGRCNGEVSLDGARPMRNYVPTVSGTIRIFIRLYVGDERDGSRFLERQAQQCERVRTKRKAKQLHPHAKFIQIGEIICLGNVIRFICARE